MTCLDEDGNTVILAVPADNEDYSGSLTLPFTVEKATITLKADDKQATTGSELPELTYTPLGLAAGESLKTVPALACDDAGMDTAGELQSRPAAQKSPTRTTTMQISFIKRAP